jgi:transcription elongation GreA/GreB family factor
MTRAGAEALRKKIAALEDKLRACLKEKGHAAEVGGNVWHDNFAFEEAQSQERMIAFEIRRALDALNNVHVVDAPENSTTLRLGTTIRAEFADRGTQVLTIVGFGEADPDKGLIAYNSPLGKSLLGAKPGETRNYQVAGRQFEVTVIEIRNSNDKAKHRMNSHDSGWRDM